MMADIQSDIWINIDSPQSESCHLLGYLTNEAALREQLNVSGDSLNVLLDAAFKLWDKQVNQHLLGDYVIVYKTNQKLLITSSARASYTLYYQMDRGLVLSSDLTRMSKVVSEPQFMRNMVLGPLADNQTPFEGVSRLQGGETRLWQISGNVELTHQALLSNEQQSALAQQVRLPEAMPLIAPALADTKLTDLFNRLPQLAHQLGQPISDAGLAHFDQLLSATDAQMILLDSQWLNARNRIGEQRFEQSHHWCKSVFKRRLSKSTAQLKATQKTLATAYKASSANQSQSFNQWLDFNYVLPAWCQLLQDIARLHGKVLVNPFLQPAKALNLVMQVKAQPPQGYFSLEQASINNVLDAMQRLFYMGEKNTNTLFKLDPVTTRSVLKQHQNKPRQVEQLCIKLLTFDYLSRFGPLTLSQSHF